MQTFRLIILNSALLLIILLFSNQSYADLTLLGQGTSVYGTYNLIYDTDLDITWYDFSNPLDQWKNQVDWAAALSVTFGSTVYTDWRLPIIPADPYVWGYDGKTTFGYNISSNEFGHLFYTELGNKGLYDKLGNTPQPGWGLNDTGDFQNLLATFYWSNTEWSHDPAGNAIYFSTHDGYHNLAAKQANNMYGIAVMDGMAIVPEPISSILFFTGGTLIAGQHYIKTKKKI